MLQLSTPWQRGVQAGTIIDKRQTKKLRKSQSANPVAPAGLVDSGSDPTPTLRQPGPAKPTPAADGKLSRPPEGEVKPAFLPFSSQPWTW